MLLSTSQLPPSSSNVPWVTSALDVVGTHRITTERRTSPACILWKASSMSSRPMRSETNFSSGSRPCRYRLIRVGKSRSGRQSPYQRRLQRSAAGEEVHQRHLQRHVRGGHADQHDGAGQVAGVERLLPGLGAADRVDDDVGAEAVGQVLDGLDRVELAWR